MGIMVKCFTLTALILGFVVAMVGSSYAASLSFGTPTTGMCTFTDAGGPACCTLIHLNPGQCFSLTDVTLANNNGTRRLNVDSGDPSQGSSECSSASEKLVYWFTGADTEVQDFETGIQFSGGSRGGPGTDVLLSTDNANHNITGTVSGLLFSCSFNGV